MYALKTMSHNTGLQPVLGRAVQVAPTVALLRGFELEAPVSPQAGAEPGLAAKAPPERSPLREGFRIGSLHLMVRYEDGNELIDMPPVYRLPNAPAWFLGMTNLHGTPVPAWDLAHFFGVEDIAVFQAYVIGLVEEALALYARHVKNVQGANYVFQPAHLGKGRAHLNHVLPQVVGNAQFLRGNEHEAGARISAHSVDEAVHRAAELKIAA